MGSAIRAQSTRDGHAELLVGQLVTGDWFDVLGIRPAAGRLLTAADTRTAGGPPIVVLSHAYWTSAFARDPGVVGTTLAVNGAPLTIVGVAAKGFDGVSVGERVSAWLPVTMQMETRFHGNASISNADWRKPWLPPVVDAVLAFLEHRTARSAHFLMMSLAERALVCMAAGL